MIRQPFILLMTVIALSSLASMTVSGAEGWYTEGGNYMPSTRIKTVVKNPLSVARENCPVVVRRENCPFTNFGPRELIVVDPFLPPRPEPTKEEKLRYGGHLPREETNGRYIPYQVDDLDRDGIWDEIFFMTDLEPNEEKTIYLYIGYNNRGLYPHKTFAAVADYARHPAPMWESEYLTWKLFYPTDVDIQAKRELMLNGYFTLTSNMSGYHFEDEKGSDIMTVSTTFGGGGICLFEHPAFPDSVSRPLYSPWRKTGPLNDTRFVFDVVASGPLRSIVRAHTMNWRTGNGEYDCEQFYTAYAGKNYSTCRVRYNRFFPVNAATSFGCGIRKIMFEDEMIQVDGFVISNSYDMPVIDPNPETIDRERATIDFAGIALIVKDEYHPVFRAIRAFQGNYAFCIPATDDRCYEYLITAAWSGGKIAETPEKFREYVKTTALEYNNPAFIKSLTLEHKDNKISPIEYWGWDDVHMLR